MVGDLLSKSIIPNRSDVHFAGTHGFRCCLGYDRADGRLPNSWFGCFVHPAGIRGYQPGSCTNESVNHFEFGDHSGGICPDDGILISGTSHGRGRSISIALVFQPLLPSNIILLKSAINHRHPFSRACQPLEAAPTGQFGCLRQQPYLSVN